PGHEPAPRAHHRGFPADFSKAAQHRTDDLAGIYPPQAPLPGTAAPRRWSPVTTAEPARATQRSPKTAICHMTYETENPDIQALRPRLQAPDAGMRRIALIDLADLEDPDGLVWLVDSLRHDPA